MKKTNSTKKIVVAALLCALVCVATMIIKVPSPLKGYLNLGDGVVLIAGFLLSPAYAFLSAGLGSALADLLSGYVIYAPATFFIKGIMALVTFFTFKVLNKKIKKLPSRIVAGILAEIVMVGGYLLFEGVLYGFGASLVNVPPNIIQGVAGIILSCTIMTFFENSKIAKL